MKPQRREQTAKILSFFCFSITSCWSRWIAKRSRKSTNLLDNFHSYTNICKLTQSQNNPCYLLFSYRKNKRFFVKKPNERLFLALFAVQSFREKVWKFVKIRVNSREKVWIWQHCLTRQDSQHSKTSSVKIFSRRFDRRRGYYQAKITNKITFKRK
jgi:hypothetical protein